MTIKAIANGKIIKSEIEHEGTKEHSVEYNFRIAGLPTYPCVCVCKCDDELVVIFFFAHVTKNGELNPLWNRTKASKAQPKIIKLN